MRRRIVSLLGSPFFGVSGFADGCGGGLELSPLLYCVSLGTAEMGGSSELLSLHSKDP